MMSPLVILFIDVVYKLYLLLFVLSSECIVFEDSLYFKYCMLCVLVKSDDCFMFSCLADMITHSQRVFVIAMSTNQRRNYN